MQIFQGNGVLHESKFLTLLTERQNALSVREREVSEEKKMLKEEGVKRKLFYTLEDPRRPVSYFSPALPDRVDCITVNKYNQDRQRRQTL